MALKKWKIGVTFGFMTGTRHWVEVANTVSEEKHLSLMSSSNSSTNSFFDLSSSSSAVFGSSLPKDSSVSTSSYSSLMALSSIALSPMPYLLLVYKAEKTIIFYCLLILSFTFVLTVNNHSSVCSIVIWDSPRIAFASLNVSLFVSSTADESILSVLLAHQS